MNEERRIKKEEGLLPRQKENDEGRGDQAWLIP
jgi:hypothetical protein